MCILKIPSNFFPFIQESVTESINEGPADNNDGSTSWELNACRIGAISITVISAAAFIMTESLLALATAGISLIVTIGLFVYENLNIEIADYIQVNDLQNAYSMPNNVVYHQPQQRVMPSAIQSSSSLVNSPSHLSINSSILPTSRGSDFAERAPLGTRNAAVSGQTAGVFPTSPTITTLTSSTPSILPTSRGDLAERAPLGSRNAATSRQVDNVFHAPTYPTITTSTSSTLPNSRGVDLAERVPLGSRNADVSRQVDNVFHAPTPRQESRPESRPAQRPVARHDTVFHVPTTSTSSTLPNSRGVDLAERAPLGSRNADVSRQVDNVFHAQDSIPASSQSALPTSRDNDLAERAPLGSREKRRRESEDETPARSSPYERATLGSRS